MRKCRNCQNILNKLHGFFMLRPFDPVFLGTWQKHCCMRSSNKLCPFYSLIIYAFMVTSSKSVTKALYVNSTSHRN